MIWYMYSARMQNVGFPPPSVSVRSLDKKSSARANAKTTEKVIPGPFCGRSAHSPRSSHASY